MSDNEDDYEYEYDDDDDDDGNGGGDNNDNMDEEDDNQFQYTDEEDDQDDVVVALENSYYNAKGLRDSSVSEATTALENVIVQEQEQLKKEGSKRLYGMWSYKAMKQLVKLHLRVGSNIVNSTGGLLTNQETIMKYYKRLLECISTSNSTDISPALIEKGITTMLERVASLNNNRGSGSSTASTSSIDNNTTTRYTPNTLALEVYDATLAVFHPKTGSCKIERLWFKSNLKYGQLLYEMNDTTKLQMVLDDLIQIHGDPDHITNQQYEGTNAPSVSTNSMEIYALQIQLYSRLKDNKRLRDTFHKAMNVRGGIPHPRTVALIQELGGKMYMSHNEYEEASKTFFQAFKSYDEAGDISRLRCLKYLVMASMLHASQINPFDSQEARPYRDDPEIVAMTNLVRAFHNNDIHSFERILQKNHGRIMGDEFIRERIEDLLRTIRIQVLRRFIRPYERISLSAIATALNDISIAEVEILLVHLILDGRLDGWINRTDNLLLKHVEYGVEDSSGKSAGASTTAATAKGTAPSASNSSSGSGSTSTTTATSSGGSGFNRNEASSSSPSNNNQSIVKTPMMIQCEVMQQMMLMLEDISRQNTSWNYTTGKSTATSTTASAIMK